jgi:hypothetical protein
MTETNLREAIAPEIEELLTSEILSPEEREKIREEIVGTLNKVVNLPIIGEAVEAAIFRFIVKIAEKIVLRYAGQLRDRVLRALD